ncbi:MAG: hypothetical protein LC797_16880 [Chloroflexi bacterium]|nr:hypothetical protein [Chloroflexota bacterium]
MALLALAYPIPPGRTDDWRQFMAELNGPRRGEYEASQQRVGVHSWVFLQQSPQGDLVLVAMEGADPARAFEQIWAGNDAFTEWFVQQVKDIHSIDLREPPPGPLPELVLDSGPEVEPASADLSSRSL